MLPKAHMYFALIDALNRYEGLKRSDTFLIYAGSILPDVISCINKESQSNCNRNVINHLACTYSLSKYDGLDDKVQRAIETHWMADIASSIPHGTFPGVNAIDIVGNQGVPELYKELEKKAENVLERKILHYPCRKRATSFAYKAAFELFVMEENPKLNKDYLEVKDILINLASNIFFKREEIPGLVDKWYNVSRDYKTPEELLKIYIYGVKLTGRWKMAAEKVGPKIIEKRRRDTGYIENMGLACIKLMEKI